MAEKRSKFLIFMNTSPGETSAYTLVGDGVTELSVAYNPQVNTEQFIINDSATSIVTGYQPNAPVTKQAIKGDGEFEFINALRRRRAILEDAKTDVVLVDAYEKEEGGAYPAQKQAVTIQIDSYGGAASDPLSIGYTINWCGDPMDGKFNLATKTFTEASEPTE